MAWFARGDPALLAIPFIELDIFPFMFWLFMDAIMFALGMLFMFIP
jgi:hypothetical protein